MSWKLAILAPAAILAAAPAHASTLIYDASDYTGGSHGLWTNQLDSGADRYYSFQDGTVFTVDTDTGTATLTGTALNPSNVLAVIDLTFTNFLETTFGTSFAYKQESGAAYDPVTDINDVDFFSGGSGTITIDGTVYSLAAGDPFASNTVFQYGQGANAKVASDFGGSAWLLVDGQNAHWDLNFKLTPAVPEPSTWIMFLIGFFGVGAMLRRGKARTLVTVSYA